MAAAAPPAAGADAASSGHQFSSIFLGQRGGLAQGQLRMTPAGFSWRRNGGGKPVEIKQQEIVSLHWTRVQRGFQLGVRVNDGPTTNFIGFREKDLEAFQTYCKQQYSKEVKELNLSTAGRNWGNVELNGRSLLFLVDGKLGFEVPMPDVAQAQQMKDDLMLEFHVDDLTSGERQDQLTELALHLPAQLKKKDIDAVEAPDGAAAEGADPPAKKLLDSLVQYTDTGATSTDTAAASFSDVHILAPRGRFEVEMMLGGMQLVGQAQDFKIRYQSIQRIFILPKTSTPHTLVVVSLDPPIRKGQTYYTHILCQFPSDEQVELDLDITAETLAAKNEKTGGKLEMHMAGPIHEIFSRTLRGLSGAKITRPGGFRNAAGDGYAVRCSYKADDGYLYPLDRAFFYVHKPPMLLPFEDVESVELTRLGGNTVSSKTFDLVVRTKMDTEHQFRGIQRREWQVLLDFFQAKKLRVERLRETQAGQAQGGRAGINFDDEEGGHDDDDEDEDEDFDAEKHSGSAPGSSEEGSDDESGDAEVIDEEGISVKAVMGGKKDKAGGGGGGAAAGEEKKVKKEKKDKPAKKRPAGGSDEEAGDADEGAPKKKAKAKKGKEEDADKEGKPAKKTRAKKDPNAPKNALSAFMYFSNATRDKIKAENPGIAFGEVGKLLGERWKAATAEDKAPFEELARKDKERYQRQMADFKAGGAGGGGGAKGGSGGGAGDDDEGGDDE